MRPHPQQASPDFAVDLYWLPLGAGGHFVRLNGRIYEALVAWRDRRPRRDLYHSALIVTLPAGHYVIEQAWSIPTGDRRQRGVVAEGPVATRIFDLVPDVPTPVWGRDELGAGEMWNSNSLISWLITRAGLRGDAVDPPRGGRAPGWHAGVNVARRHRTPSPVSARWLVRTRCS